MWLYKTPSDENCWPLSVTSSGTAPAAVVLGEMQWSAAGKAGSAGTSTLPKRHRYSGDMPEMINISSRTSTRTMLPPSSGPERGLIESTPPSLK